MNRVPPKQRRPRWRACVAAVATVVPACVGLVTSGGPAAASAPAPASGWSTVWSDDFNGAAGSGVNTSNWLYDTGTSYPGGAANWGTGEVETMTSSTANVYQDGNGNLAIKPIRDSSGNWTSGRIETQNNNFAPPAGGVLRVKARVMLPNVSGAGAQGYWPAFWMLGGPFRGNYTNWPSVGEMDTLESVNGQAQVHGTFHCGVAPGGPCNEYNGLGGPDTPSSDPWGNWHTYTIEWDTSTSPQELRWYVDGDSSTGATPYWVVKSTDVDATTWQEATDHGYMIILNVAMGGSWPGSPTSSTVSGAPMLVDYVAVYQKAASSGGGATAGASGPVKSAFVGKCMDVSGANSANGTHVQLWDCNGTNAQAWTQYSDGTLRALGKCLDTGGGTADGTKLQIWDCNGTGAQVWQVSNAGYVNPQSGRCLDDPSSSTTNGTQLQLWDCNSTAAQVWSTPGGAVGNTGGPAGYTWCANENGTCTFSGTANVAFGADTHFNYLSATNSIACNTSTFGDPYPGVAKACYYQITSSGGGGTSATSTIQAENYNNQSGTQTETCSDTGGGQDVGWISNGDWLEYDNVNFGSTGLNQFQARVASGAASGVSGTVEVVLDNLSNAPIGSFSIANTGGWQTWEAVPANIAGTTGTHTVYLKFATGSGQDFVNVNWFTFS